MIIKITWQVDDGYAGGRRPQYSEFDTYDYVDSDEEWEALPIDEKDEYINGFIQEEFENRVSWSIEDTEKVYYYV